MFKIVIITIMAAAPFVLEAGDAKAQGRNSATSGTCPAGSCAVNGGARAANVNNCKPSNCRAGSHQSRPLRSQ